MTESRRAVVLAAIVTVSVIAIGTGAVGPVAANGHTGGDVIVVQEGESIQQAVNQANSGDVIEVEAGLYEETVRVNTSDITIRAADPSNPPTVRYAPDQPMNNATFEVLDNYVTLANLTIERVGHPDRNGSNPTAAVAIIPVDSNRPTCWPCNDEVVGVTVEDNTIAGDFPLKNDTAAGVGITDGIDYIFFTDVAGDASDITIRDNEIYGFSAGAGIGAEYGGTVTDVRFVGNYIHDNLAEDDNGSAQGTGVGFVRNTTQGYFENITVTGNDISNNHYGVRIAGNATNETLEDVDASVIEVHRNDIAGNSEWGAMNNGTNVLNATHNWWGDSSGPSGEGEGDGDAVSAGVEYDPYLEEPTT